MVAGMIISFYRRQQFIDESHEGIAGNVIISLNHSAIARANPAVGHNFNVRGCKFLVELRALV